MFKFILSLIIPLLIAFAIVYWYKRKNNKNLTDFKTAGIAAFLFYISIIGMVIITNYTLKNELQAFDINGDGFFSGNEINDGQRAAMRKVISDTGRNFAPIIGIIYSIIYFTIVFVLLKTFKRIQLILIKN